MKDTASKERRSILLSIAALLQRLAELNEVQKANQGEPPKTEQNFQREETQSSSGGHREGARVRITRKDAYHNMTGTIIDQRGTTYWNVRLDQPGKKGEMVIYKMPKHLLVL